MKKIFLSLTFAMTLFCPAAAWAESLSSAKLAEQGIEHIRSFASQIIISQDGSIMVTETIEAYAQNVAIRHGIYRDFPTTYRDRFGNRYRVTFDVIEVTRDGMAEPYHLERRSNGQRVYIGDADIFVDAGYHTYTLQYRTRGQLGFFDDHDELYWNVTGNGWNFSISQASAAVRLPEGVFPPDATFDAYTGLSGSTEKNFTARLLDSGGVYFETTQPLAMEQGLTIVVGWPKGHVRQPSRTDQVLQFFIDNLVLAFTSLLFVVVAFYYGYTWHRFGRDPKKGAIIPEYDPPASLGPAGMRYVKRWGAYDHKVLVAAILDLAVGGFIKIEEQKGFLKKFYRLTQIQNPPRQPNPEQVQVLGWIFSASDVLEVGKKYNKDFAQTNTLYQAFLSKRHEHWFVRNTLRWAVGAVLLALAVILNFKLASALVSIIYMVTSIALGVLAAFLLRKPTPEGRKVLDQIEGFKWFLSVTEKDRMNFHNPPERTPELFEKYLPHALALGVEHQWSEQFAQVFKNLEAQGTAYHPAWFIGTSALFNPIDFGESMSHSFQNAISASSTKPGSSSGAGGGSSGGGGGGGGGGGW